MTIDKIRLNVLLVDDHPENLMVLEAVLDDPRYKLMKASSGKEALDLIAANDIDLILLDVFMPGMDGYETAKKIKELPNGKNAAIIFITAIYKDETHVRRGYNAGGLDYITKPIDPEILRSKVDIFASHTQQDKQFFQLQKWRSETQELLEKQRKLENIFENLPVGVILADVDGRIYGTNKEAERIWAGKEKLPNFPFAEFIGWWAQSGEFIKPSEWALARGIKPGEKSQYENVQIQCVDGEKKIISSSTSSLYDNGKLVGAFAVVIDSPLEEGAGPSDHSQDFSAGDPQSSNHPH